MTDQFLKPPARASHGLVIGISMGLVLGLGAMLGHLATVVVGIATAALFIGGFWGLSRDAWLYTVAGSTAVIIGAVGVVCTPLLAVLLAARAGSTFGWFLWSAVPLGMVGGVVAVVADLVPRGVTEQDRAALVALIYGAGLATVLFATTAGVRLGLTTAFGASLAAGARGAVKLLVGFVTLTGVTRFGALVFLLGACLWYSTRLARLPLVHRSSRWLAHRWHAADTDTASAAVIPSDAAQTGQATAADPDDAGTRPPAGDQPLLRDVVGIGPGWLRLVRLAGVGLLGVGVVALVLGSAPDTRPVAASHPVGRLLDEYLGSTVTPQFVLGSLAVAMGGLRLGHAVAWQVIHVDWTAHRRRLAYAGGSGIVILGAALLARPLVTALLGTPAVQFVLVEPAGPPPPVIAVEHRPELFASQVRAFMGLVGVHTLGVGLVAALVGCGSLLVVAVGIGAAATRLAHPTAGFGLLFLGAAGAAVLGVSTPVAVAAGAVTLLGWEMHTFGTDIARQLDPAAATMRGELVHLSVHGIIIGLVIGLTGIGAWVGSIVPIPTARWQVVGALICSIGAGLVGLLVLGVQREQ